MMVKCSVPGGEGFMRLNVATPRSILKQALQQLEKAVAQTLDQLREALALTGRRV